MACLSLGAGGFARGQGKDDDPEVADPMKAAVAAAVKEMEAD